MLPVLHMVVLLPVAAALVVAAAPCVAAALPVPAGEEWTRIATPAPGRPESIGSPGAGCVRGASSLTPDGPGFRFMRLSRKRFYGHPLLLETLRDAAARMEERKAGTLLIGDLSLPRGGPANGSSHGSHQSGLDADVWLSLAEEFDGGRPFTLGDREALSAKSVFGNEDVEGARAAMIREFASRPAVDRIFVSAPIKRELCRLFPSADDASWLRKVRPWYGHADHVHIRVVCPEDSPACVPGPPLPEGSGCDASLEWWFGNEAKSAERTGPRKEPLLPEECRSVLAAPEWE